MTQEKAEDVPNFNSLILYYLILELYKSGKYNSFTLSDKHIQTKYNKHKNVLKFHPSTKYSQQV